MNEIMEATDAKQVMSVADLNTNIKIIQDVMKNVMVEGVHYGVIPGCGKKPTLLKPGAEVLMATFHLAGEPVINDLSTSDEMRYQITMRILYAPTGVFLGSGVGEASSNEKKYKWREAVCDEEFEATPENMRQIYWKKGWNGAKATSVKQVRANMSDIANTVLKMGKKRSQSDAVLSVTGASSLFTQDIEDMREILNKADNKSTTTSTKPPQSKSKPKDTGDGKATCFIQEIKEFNGIYKSGKNKGKDYIKTGIVGDNGITYGTFDKALGTFAKKCKGSEVEIDYEQNGDFFNATNITPIEQQD